jgi:hypothetical protein
VTRGRLYRLVAWQDAVGAAAGGWVPCIRGDTLVAADRRFADCAVALHKATSEVFAFPAGASRGGTGAVVDAADLLRSAAASQNHRRCARNSSQHLKSPSRTDCIPIGSQTRRRELDCKASHSHQTAAANSSLLRLGLRCRVRRVRRRKVRPSWLSAKGPPRKFQTAPRALCRHRLCLALCCYVPTVGSSSR